MNKTTRTILSVAVTLCLLASGVSSCGCSKKAKTVVDWPIEHELEFGGVYVMMTIDEFNALGYEYGDSVDVVFSNGLEFRDIPYYNGYYTANNEPLIVAYPGYPYIKITLNNGADIWTKDMLLGDELDEIKKLDLWTRLGLEDGDVVTIKLHKAKEYADIQDARNIQYEDERSKFTSDEEFANFRSISVSGMKTNTVYRSASPCDNQHNRAPYVDSLISKAGVGFILDLADTDAKIEGYMAKDDFNSPYFKSLHEAGKVVPIALNMNYESDAFKEKVVNGLTAMSESTGPYLVHCTEGKDRTGYVCALLGALCGASYEELRDDYMITYDNYYKISKTNDTKRYQTIIDSVFEPIIASIVNDASADYKKCDLAAYAEKMLNEAGMTAAQIAALKANIAV